MHVWADCMMCAGTSTVSGSTFNGPSDLQDVPFGGLVLACHDTLLPVLASLSIW